MDLPLKVSNNGDILAKYSYLADGTKISAMDSTGTCYRYYGPMVYTVGANGSKSLESAAIAAGRISSSGVRYHVTDHLGSVRAVVNGNTGTLVETSKYSIYGARSAGFMSVTSSSPETRYRFTGKEDQSPAFGISYTDFGARHYSPNLRRWLVPDPLSEQYYDVSPYAYCAGDPVNLVDKDGNVPHVVVGAVVGAVAGAVVNGGIALYKGKSGSEFWGAVAGGAVGGAIEGAVAAATGGVSLATGGGHIIAGEALGGLLGGAAQSVTEQAIGSGSVDVKKVAIDSGVGAAAGGLLGGFKKIASKEAGNLMRNTQAKYNSSSFKSLITKEVQKEFKSSGKALGKSGKRELKREIANRCNDFTKVETTLVEIGEQGTEQVVGAAVEVGKVELTDLIYE